MRVAIVDDLQTDSAALYGMLNARIPSPLSVDVYDSGERFLSSERKYDLVFLDIVMRGLNGIETARRLRELDMRCLIVFLTTSNEYAWDAFPEHPFDYLLKPVDETRLEQLLCEAKRALKNTERVLPLKVGRQTETVGISTISYICAQDHHVCVTLTQKRELKCFMKFGEIHTMLRDEPRFLACNRGVLINMDEVRSFDGECFVMNDAQRFPVRQSEKTQIRERFYAYMFRKARGVE